MGRRHSDRKWPRHARDAWLFCVTVLVLLALSQISRNQQSNTRALCSFRTDLQKRVRSGSDFLKAHPNGIPGIPPAVIRVSLANERHTLGALRPLVCPRSS